MLKWIKNIFKGPEPVNDNSIFMQGDATNRNTPSVYHTTPWLDTVDERANFPEYKKVEKPVEEPKVKKPRKPRKPKV